MSSVLLVDSGNLLFKQPVTRVNNTIPLITANGILRAYAGIGYDVVAVSAMDLTAGIDFFHASLDDSFPWVSANVFNKDEKRLFPSHNIKKIGSLSIGIIGLTGDAQYLYEGLTIGDWRTALQTEIELIEKNCDILMVLSNLTGPENEELASDFPQVSLIVTNYQKRGNSPPKVLGNSLFSQIAGRGKYLGQLEINWHSQGRWHVEPSQLSTQLENKLVSIERQIRQLEKQQAETNKDLTQKISRMKSYRNNLSNQISQAEIKPAVKGKKTSNNFKSTFLPVLPSSSPASMEEIVQDIKKSVNTYNRHRLNNFKSEPPVSLSMLQIEEIADFSSCRQCHEKQTSFWQNTAHAGAFKTLSMRGQSFNLECLPCHVTGGNIGPSSTDEEKLLLLSLGDDRKTIGCDVCHGPGKAHILSPPDVTPVRSPPEELCMRCHTPDRDDHFDYSNNLSMIACPAG